MGCQSYSPFEGYYPHDFNSFFLKLCRFNTFQFAHAYARGEGMKHYVNMVQEPEFAAREKGYTFVSHQQEVGAGYFDDVTTVIQGGQSSVKALTGSTEEEQFAGRLSLTPTPPCRDSRDCQGPVLS